jgi:CHAT domain-containing protein
MFKSCSIAHFACHGLADGVEPAKSALIVGKEREEKLTLEDLDAVIHDSAQIAYLSACSTAEIKVQNLADKSIHLASTFQLSGFQHVIETLWGADDSAAVEIAAEFYENLVQHTKDGGTSVARALHEAVICYRNTGANCMDIFKWAPFVHLGCWFTILETRNDPRN